jgi:thiamine pyrophosphate-dependent acetolactate synthase large subunit-like protein
MLLMSMLRVPTQEEVGKGAFQELDQVAAARQLCKFAARATSAAAVPTIIQQAIEVGAVLRDQGSPPRT